MIATRPTSHDERDQIVRATDPGAPNPGLDAAAKEVLQRIFMAPRETYLVARANYATATSRYLTATLGADTADDAFDAAFRHWQRTVTRSDGKAATRELAGLMDGTLPSELVELPYPTEITKVKGLLDKLPASLAGDSSKLTSLKAAVTAFEPLVAVQAQACRDKIAAGARLAEATIGFDAAYGKLVKAMKGLLGDEATLSILPRFVRKDRRPAADKDAGQAEPTDGTPKNP